MNKIKKTIVAVSAVTMMLAFFAVPANVQAKTMAELEAEIAVLMAQISKLTGSTTTGGSSYTFTNDLTIGSTGTDVMELQKFLNAKGFQVSASGAGSPGQESTYFGALTASALARYQAANNIAPAVGYFGPMTRANVNATGGSTTPGGDDDSDTGSGDLEGGAGDIEVTERSSGTEDEVLEGDEDVKVLGFEVEADGSDIAITSVRVEFEHEGSGSDRLDRYVDEVSVMLGDKVVGTANVDDFSESSDVYSRNIPVTGVVDEDETARLYVAVTAVNNVDSDDIAQAWEVAIGQIRFEDATGAILTDSTGTGVLAGSGVTTAIGESFTFEDLSSSGDIELDISEDDLDVNDTHSVSVDDSSDTNDVEILSFLFSAEGSDIFPDTVSFGVTSNSGTGVTEIANDFRLLMNDDEVGTVTIDKDCDGGSDGFASSTDEAVCVVVSDLDDDDVAVEEGEEISFMLIADINDIEGGFSSGDDLSVTLNGDVTLSSNGHITADDENGDALTVSELSGSADSSNIEFLSTGISVETFSTNNPTQSFGVESSATDNTGLFEITYDVTAIEDAAYIELGSATRGTSETNTSANFVLQDNTNSYAATTTGSIALSDVTSVSGGTTSGNFVRIGAGETARFKLSVTFDPGHLTGTSEGYRMYLYSVNSAATAVDATAQQVLTPEADYRTGATTIGN